MSETTPKSAQSSLGKRRKLRPLVITMGSKRQSLISNLFSHPSISPYFEPPIFSEGVPQRDLSSRTILLKHAGQAGILPPEEWEVLKPWLNSSVRKTTTNHMEAEWKDRSESLWEYLSEHVPVKPGRRGGDFDVKMHYSKELWQKAKSINRGRAVLACTLAHLKAMQKLTESGYDFILEDNVRAPLDCADRIWNAIDASLEWQEQTGEECHMRYFGWLGSRTNLEFLSQVHGPRARFSREINPLAPSFFPFPVTSDFDCIIDDSGSGSNNQHEKEEELREREQTPKTDEKKQKPGGTPIWGAFAYWVSKTAHQHLLLSLQSDVGALLWKGKRMRHHVVKPVDKVVPRRIVEKFGRDCIHVTEMPAFVRAPMLTSQIHSQWDAEFCKSTEYQMEQWGRWEIGNSEEEESNKGLTWENIWLSEEELKIVQHQRDTSDWITLGQLAELTKANDVVAVDEE